MQSCEFSLSGADARYLATVSPKADDSASEVTLRRNIETMANQASRNGGEPTENGDGECHVDKARDNYRLDHLIGFTSI